MVGRRPGQPSSHVRTNRERSQHRLTAQQALGEASNTTRRPQALLSLGQASVGDVPLILTCDVGSNYMSGKGAEMSGNIASEKSNGTEPSTPMASAVPTGFRVCLVPGALEISARLATPEEVRSLMKVLRAGIVMLEDTTEGDMDEPVRLTKRVAALNAAPPK
jgi:hypothetical protein